MTRVCLSLLLACSIGCARSQAAETRNGLLVPDSSTVPGAIGAGGSSYRLASKILGESRQVLIGLPGSYGVTHRTYPVIIVLDGEASFRPAMTVATELASLGHIPQSIVVGIPNTNRLRDLTPPGLSVSGSTKAEGGDRFLDFLQKELMPALTSEFRANGMVVLVGHSSGGILVTYAAATRPAFRFIVSMDSPTHLGDNWLPQKMMAAERDPALARLRYVSMESLYGYTDSVWKAVQTRAPKGWILERQKLDHETHVSMPFVGMYIGLRDLFKDYATKSAPESPTSATLAYYRNLEESYGAPVMPPSGLLRQVMEDFEMEGQYKPADSAWRMLVDGYGMPSDSAEWRQRLAKLAKLPPLTETVEGLLATPAPTAAEARSIVGVWRGHQWVSDDDRDSLVLRLRDSAGVVVGESVNWPVVNEELVMPLQYLKMTDGGFTWGYMNGMRPRGMLLFEGKIVNGVLTGTMRMGGIRFVRPPGMPEPPTLRFELRKAKN